MHAGGSGFDFVGFLRWSIWIWLEERSSSIVEQKVLDKGRDIAMLIYIFFPF